MKTILAPSDLARELSTGASLQVGGRVAHVDGLRLVLADALKAVTILLGEPSEAQPGDLVVIDVRRNTSGELSGSLRQRNPAPEPRGDGEFSRLAHGSRGRHLAARSRALSAIRAYFEAENFLEVQTPTFVPSPGLDPHVHSLAQVQTGGRTHHLITSPEFHMKRLMVGGLPRIYQLARCFRAEELGNQHEPEFTMLEWYRAFASWADVAQDTEATVRIVFEALGGPEIAQRPFDRITVREAFHKYAGHTDAIKLAEQHPSRYFELLVSQVEPALEHEPHPIFLTHYPLSQAALAQPDPQDPSVAQRFELYFRGVELSNGYGELTDAQIQRQRFEVEMKRRMDAKEPIYPMDERFLSALKEGLPPCAGNALGVDRLIALALGEGDLEQTLAFSDAER